MGQETAILGIVAPHPPIMVQAVGGNRTHVTSASIEAMREAAVLLERFAPETLVVMSPHAPGFADAITVDTAPNLLGSLADFGAPDARIEASSDVELAEEILHSLGDAGVSAVRRPADARLNPGVLDHGVIVPLSFLDPDSHWPLVVLSLSGLSLQAHRQAGAAIASAAANLGRRIAFVASGDLSHRLTREAPAGYAPRGSDFDDAVVDAFRASDLSVLTSIDPALIEEAGECGLRSFVALSGVLPVATSRVLAYEGPWGVGYLTAVVAPDPVAVELGVHPAPNSVHTPPHGRKGGSAGHDSHPIVVLARATIEAHVTGTAAPDAVLPADPALPERAGAFVTLHRQGSLRGCIGTIVPTLPTLAEEVVANAIKAATADPRFPPLTVEELADLDVKVDVLHASEPANIADLDPALYGVIVTNGWSRGLLLPDLHGVDTAEQQIEIALRKGGIAANQSFDLERFRVDRYS